MILDIIQETMTAALPPRKLFPLLLTTALPCVAAFNLLFLAVRTETLHSPDRPHQIRAADYDPRLLKLPIIDSLTLDEG